MPKLADKTLTKAYHLSAEYTDSAGKGVMQIKLDGQHADTLSAWGGNWYHGHHQKKPTGEIIGSTAEEALAWWIESRGFKVAEEYDMQPRVWKTM